MDNKIKQTVEKILAELTPEQVADYLVYVKYEATDVGVDDEGQECIR